jgi:hypothetical protein
MKPLSICICFCASLIACFKAAHLFTPASAVIVQLSIVLAARLVIKEIQKATEPTKEK